MVHDERKKKKKRAGQSKTEGREDSPRRGQAFNIMVNKDLERKDQRRGKGAE